jgi:hypothetical protein
MTPLDPEEFAKRYARARRRPEAAEAAGVRVESPVGDDRTQRENQAQILIRLAAPAQLFQAEGDDAVFATFPVGRHRETWRVRSSGFNRWLAHRFYTATQKPPSAQAMQDALLALEGRAQHEGRSAPVFTRVAAADGRIYVDLCKAEWNAVEITAEGWRVVAEPPVRFRRTRGMLPLPHPRAGGTLDNLRPLLNLEDEDDFILCMAWLVGAMHPRGPYPGPRAPRRTRIDEVDAGPHASGGDRPAYHSAARPAARGARPRHCRHQRVGGRVRQPV